MFAHNIYFQFNTFAYCNTSGHSLHTGGQMDSLSFNYVILLLALVLSPCSFVNLPDLNVPPF
jgi:hypothetical protein